MPTNDLTPEERRVLSKVARKNALRRAKKQVSDDPNYFKELGRKGGERRAARSAAMRQAFDLLRDAILRAVSALPAGDARTLLVIAITTTDQMEEGGDVTTAYRAFLDEWDRTYGEPFVSNPLAESASKPEKTASNKDSVDGEGGIRTHTDPA